MYRTSFRAMDTDVDVAIVGASEIDAAARAAAVEALFVRYERTLTRFSPESELAALNRSAGRPFAASPLLFAAVAAALHAAAQSGGIFDPCVYDALIGAGYDRSFAIVALTEPQEPPAPPRPLRGAYRQVRLDPATRTITLPAGCHLDLGGIGKGMAVDAAADLLGEPSIPPPLPLSSEGKGRTGGHDVSGARCPHPGPLPEGEEERQERAQGFFVNAGGDLRLAGQSDDGPWIIGVQNPFAPGADLALLAPHAGGVATSSVVRRRWTRGGVQRHHLIDPRTGTSAESDLAAVTVVARDTTTADVLAKVALILGRRAGRAFVESCGATCLLVANDGSVEISPDLPIARPA